MQYIISEHATYSPIHNFYTEYMFTNYNFIISSLLDVFYEEYSLIRYYTLEK